MDDQFKKTLEKIKNWEPARHISDRVDGYIANLETPEELKKRGAWRYEFEENEKPSKLELLHAWFNRKKTCIGMLITGIGWGLTTITPWGWAVVGFGGLFGGAGIIHKILKGQTTYGDVGEFGEKEWKALLGDIEQALKVKDYGKLILIAVSIIVSLFKRRKP